MAFLLQSGAVIADEHGDLMTPVALVLETYWRNPEGKHRCLDLFAEHGVALPDRPPVALYRGRIDRLEHHVETDPDVLDATFAHTGICPPELGCHVDETLALYGTPLAGGTLLNLCVDNDEVGMLRWLIARGADVNRRAAFDPDGLGGHTALFGCVVSQP